MVQPVWSHNPSVAGGTTGGQPRSRATLTRHPSRAGQPAVGSVTRPRNSGSPLRRSVIANRKGRSTIISTGGSGSHEPGRRGHHHGGGRGRLGARLVHVDVGLVHHLVDAQPLRGGDAAEVRLVGERERHAQRGQHRAQRETAGHLEARQRQADLPGRQPGEQAARASVVHDAAGQQLTRAGVGRVAGARAGRWVGQDDHHAEPGAGVRQLDGLVAVAAQVAQPGPEPHGGHRDLGARVRLARAGWPGPR